MPLERGQIPNIWKGLLACVYKEIGFVCLIQSYTQSNTLQMHPIPLVVEWVHIAVCGCTVTGIRGFRPLDLHPNCLNPQGVSNLAWKPHLRSGGEFLDTRKSAHGPRTHASNLVLCHIQWIPCKPKHMVDPWLCVY
jgi:hypothetical protein